MTRKISFHHNHRATRGTVDEKPRRQRGRPKGSKNRKTLKQDAACALLDSDSSDEDNPLVKDQIKRPRLGSNWREATISTGSLPKRSKGRPKGSKNKPTKAASPKKGLECHICKDPDDDSALCLTECGHLFHVHCLEQWVQTSNQKYRTLKVCPYCGSNFEKTVPFFG
ncbi:hypothetical protein FOCC_FOCC013980 [Frankliniella occidentalis]|nr:hypothetical protein FOCC_FOCC013980 [Frankliniella occidentalis]